MLCYAKLSEYPNCSYDYPLVVPANLYQHYLELKPYDYYKLYPYPIYGFANQSCQSTTQTTASGITFTCKAITKPQISDCGVYYNGKKIKGSYSFTDNDELKVVVDKLTGLTPNGCDVAPYVTIQSIDALGDNYKVPTQYLGLRGNATPTTYSLNFESGDAVIKEKKITFENKEVTGSVVTDLIPMTQYNVYYWLRTTNDYTTSYHLKITTPTPVMQTQAARMLTNRNAMLIAETNIADEETRCGFEWRRYDAPDEMPSTQVYCPVYGGIMAGVVKNMTENVYYKYRPFLKDANGKMYYGDWIAFITADANVEFDPVVYTYKAPEVTQTGATLQGVALPGSSDITDQGFEYWKVGSTGYAASGNAPQAGVVKVKAGGQRMTASVDGLTAGTTYGFRSYAVTGGKTYYGAEVTFTTDKPDGVAGDVDGNGLVDLDDINAVINIVLSLNKASDFPGTSDLDGNGMVDINDVNLLINKILKLAAMRRTMQQAAGERPANLLSDSEINAIIATEVDM